MYASEPQTGTSTELGNDVPFLAPENSEREGETGSRLC